MITILADCSGLYAQRTGITTAILDPRTLVSVKTQRSMSSQINDVHGLPEPEVSMDHAAATDHVHHGKEYKGLKAAGQPSPLPAEGFASKVYNLNYPPDPHGAVNENFVVGTVNEEMYIQDRSGNLINDWQLSAFWGPLHVTSVLFDPRLVYDPYTQTWMLVTDAYHGTDSSCLLLACSQSDDPTMPWYLYRIPADSTGELWADYPAISFNSKWVAITTNNFSVSAGGTVATGRVYLFNKNDVINGSAPGMTTFDVDLGLSPAVTYDPYDQDLYLMQAWSGPAGQIALLKISGPVGAETISTVGYPTLDMAWSAEPPNGADFAPQLGDSSKIQCNDDRMGSVVVRNGVIWGTQTVFLPAVNPTRCSVLWWALDTNADVLQHGLVDDPDGNTFYAFPSIAVNQKDDALIGYSVFSSGLYASAGYSYHDHAQWPGSMNNPYIFVNGQGPYNLSFAGRNRWGDCSATVVDPLNDIDFWTINEYADSTPDNWGTWWANVSGLDTINHDPVSLSFDMLMTPNPNGGIFNLYFTGAVNTSVQVDIYDMLGQFIYTGTYVADANSVYVNLGQSLSEGVYVARFQVNGLSMERKLIVHY